MGHTSACASVCPQRSDLIQFSHFVAKIVGHTSLRAVCPIGSDLIQFSHFVAKIVGHTGFEPGTLYYL